MSIWLLEHSGFGWFTTATAATPRGVIIHHPDGSTSTYTGDDVITDEELLPGFSLPLAEIFE